MIIESKGNIKMAQIELENAELKNENSCIKRKLIFYRSLFIAYIGGKIVFGLLKMI
jgi:hypothetical protein